MCVCGQVDRRAAEPDMLNRDMNHMLCRVTLMEMHYTIAMYDLEHSRVSPGGSVSAYPLRDSVDVRFSAVGSIKISCWRP